MRIRTLYFALGLSVAVCISCGSDSPPACKDVPACTAKPTLQVGGVACGPVTDPTQCPTAKPACMKPVVPSTDVQEILHETHTVGQVVSFTVPPGTSSITIIEQANGTDAATTPPDTVTLTSGNNSFPVENTAVPDKVTNPGGDVVYDDNSTPPADPSGLTAFFASGSPVTGAFTIPNTSKLLSTSVNGLASGQWQFVVNDFGFECFSAANCSGGSKTSTYDVRVVLKGGAPHTSGTVDVAFYLVGTESAPNVPLKAAQAPTDPGMNRMVSSLASLYASAGTCLGKVTFFDVPAWAEATYGSVLDVRDTSPCGDLNQMFTLSVPGNQLNFFLVNDLSADPNGNAQVVGIDGTIPGPSAFGGTVHSGAAVSSADIESNPACGPTLSPGQSCGADEVAYIAAHEGGHWLGLYHTTESAGDNFDPLADTAKCPCDPCVPQAQRSQCTNPSSDPNLGPVINLANCTKSTSCGGGDNLMFWLLSSRSTGALTCEQGAVMRANPVVH